jgi:hypothetical protein
MVGSTRFSGSECAKKLARVGPHRFYVEFYVARSRMSKPVRREESLISINSTNLTMMMAGDGAANSACFSFCTVHTY